MVLVYNNFDNHNLQFGKPGAWFFDAGLFLGGGVVEERASKISNFLRFDRKRSFGTIRRMDGAARRSGFRSLSIYYRGYMVGFGLVCKPA